MKIALILHSIDAGRGASLLRVFIFTAMAGVIMLIYAATQFQGFTEPRAMELAHLGRNLAQGHGFTTQCIRPVALGREQYAGDGVVLPDEGIPDTLNAPLYPLALAALFRATGVSFHGHIYSWSYLPERHILVFNLLMTLLSGVLLYFLARSMFNDHLAILAAALYFLSHTVLRAGIAGLELPQATFFTLAACLLAWKALEAPARTPPRWWRVLGGAAAAGLLCAAAGLTRYGALTAAPVLLIFFACAAPRTWRVAAAFLFLIAWLAGLAPWLWRNMQLGAGPFGLAPYMVFNDTSGLYDANTFERTLRPGLLQWSTLWGALKNKWLGMFDQLCRGDFALGEWTVLASFAFMLLLPFDRPRVNCLRWSLVAGLVALFASAGFFGPTGLESLLVFWPLMIVFATAFFLALLDQLRLEWRTVYLAMIALFGTLHALPFLAARTSYPYPPYNQPLIRWVSETMAPDELLCTDIPWATAWYGNRLSLQLPEKLEDFYTVNDTLRPIKGLYLTQVTTDGRFVSELSGGINRMWWPVMQGRVPADFPLKAGGTLLPDRFGQVFLTDRPRW